MRPARNQPPLLGARLEGGGATFAVASSGEAVTLCLFDEDGTERRVDVTERAHGVWHVHVPGVQAGQRYGYRVDGPWDPWHGHRFNPAKLLADPYARALDGTLQLDDSVFGHDPAKDDTVIGRLDSASYVPRSV